MATNTPNINLYKKDMIADGNDTFNITTMLNDNWDKIDTKFGQQDKDFIRQPAFLSATSTNNVYTATSTPEPTAYVDGMGITLKADKDSTGAITLNWNGLGTKALKDAQGNNVSLKANGIYTFKYNADMGYFILQGSNIYANGVTQTNLNADMVDGKNASDFAPAGFGLGTLATDISNQNLNNFYNTGFYRGSNMINAPSTDWYYVEVISHDTTSYVSQTLKTYGNQPNNNNAGEIYIRNKIDSTWSSWRKIQNENYAITTNNGNLYSATINGINSLTDGLQVRIKFNAAATGLITLNINSLGNKIIVDYYGNMSINVRQNLIANLCYEATSGNFILQGKGGGGNATSADLLSGKTATVDSGQITGNMPNNGSMTFVPTTINQSIPLGYHNGGGVVRGTDSLISANIKAGTSIFGVNGKSSVVDTADATALTADKIVNGYSAYANGSKINGSATIESLGGVKFFTTGNNESITAYFGNLKTFYGENGYINSLYTYQIKISDIGFTPKILIVKNSYVSRYPVAYYNAYATLDSNYGSMHLWSAASTMYFQDIANDGTYIYIPYGNSQAGSTAIGITAVG